MYSDDADTLASEICLSVIYPRFADFIRSAIVHCTLDAEPLTDEQTEAIYTAVFEAGDGVRQQVAHTIDRQIISEFRRGLEADDGESAA